MSQISMSRVSPLWSQDFQPQLTTQFLTPLLSNSITLNLNTHIGDSVRFSRFAFRSGVKHLQEIEEAGMETPAVNQIEVRRVILRF